MRNYLIAVLAVILFAALFVGAFLYATSAEAWYAGQHAAGCNGTDNCGCYERLTKGNE